MLNGAWNIPTYWREAYPVVTKETSEQLILDRDEGELLWTGCSEGIMSVKKVYNFYRQKEQKFNWKKSIWTHFIPPKVLIFIWKAISDRLVIAATLCKWKSIPSAVCLGYITRAVETLEHMLMQCEIASNIWRWLSEKLNVNLIAFSSVMELVKWASNQKQNCAIG